MRSVLVLADSWPDHGDALAEIDGQPAIRHVAESLPASVDELVVSCSSERRGAITDALGDLDYRLAVEPIPERGPVAALRTGFRIATGSTVAVVSGDAAGVDGDLFDALFDAVDTAAVPRAGDRLFPLYAVYDRYAGRKATERTLALGSERLYDLLTQIDPVVVDADAVCDAEDGLPAAGTGTTEATVLGDPGS